MTYNERMENIYKYCKSLGASRDEAEFFTIIYGNKIKGDINDELTHVEIKQHFHTNRDKLKESIKESTRYNEESRLHAKVRQLN